MTNIALYAAPGSCARVSMVGLEHVGLTFEYRLVRPMRQETRSPEYLAMNPKGKVPVLAVDGEILTENVAILTYLARRYPEAKLLPPAASDMASMQQIADLCYCSATLHPIVTRLRNPHFFADSDDAKQQVRQRAIEAMMPNFDLIQARLRLGPWWYGQDWSVMDAYIYWVWFRSGGVGLPTERYPEIAEFAQRMESRESVQKMLRREAAAEQQLRAEGLLT
jgi:glutathione S-transferase